MIEWTCVVDDGTRPYGPGIQIDQRRPLHLVVGDEQQITVLLINPVGGVVRLESSEFLQLTGRTLCRPSRQLFTRRSTGTAQFQQLIEFTPTATATIQPQRGVFDLWLIRGPERISIIPLSELLFTGSALGNNYQ